MKRRTKKLILVSTLVVLVVTAGLILSAPKHVAIYGEHDALVEPKTNRLLLEIGPAAGGNTRATIIVVPRGSHGFIQKNGVCPQEFKDIPSQAPEFFQAIAAWDPFR